ncbi:Aminodeoxychorismate lyase [Pleurostoma richardsiae]|uniref:Aminodeoxychorismate lyase n=1 Tax=Pleurostoma richardsiae TaxID=41990 RepID=A0AA38VPR8_9PEZI|nr:Aminodeoxychorismate lyase [Pleurostoma richardsiae]
MSERFQLFTSLRYDPALADAGNVLPANGGWNSRTRSPFYMLDYHRDRMLRAATHWGWTRAADAIAGEDGLKRLDSFLLQNVTGRKPLRVKVILSQDGVLQQPIWKVYIDTELTNPSEFTHYKTTKRAMYDEARRRASLKVTDTSEVLIVNELNGTVMEGSVTTPYFWRDDRWVTPPVSHKYTPEVGSGGQDGTTRRWALERGLAVEEGIKADSVTEGEDVWVSNGVRGFIFGKIKSPR